MISLIPSHIILNSKSGEQVTATVRNLQILVHLDQGGTEASYLVADSSRRWRKNKMEPTIFQAQNVHLTAFRQLRVFVCVNIVEYCGRIKKRIQLRMMITSLGQYSSTPGPVTARKKLVDQLVVELL